MNISAVSTYDCKPNKSPNFGMLYSKKTVRSLKKAVPELIESEGVESVKQAVANLKMLGQRKDNIVAELVNEDHCYGIEIAVNHVKDKKTNGFIYCVGHPSCLEIASRSKTGFKDFTESLMTDDFVNAANTSIDKYNASIANETILDKVARKKDAIVESLCDAGDWLKDQFALEDVCQDGKIKTSIVGWENIKDAVKDAFGGIKKSSQGDVVALRKEIDSLPTKLK